MLGLGLSLGLRRSFRSDTWAGAVSPFKIKLNAAGGTATLALSTLYSYDCDIDWGDGQSEHFVGVGVPIIHTFTPAGVYTVTVTPRTFYGFPAIQYNNANNRALVLEVVQWGNSGWKSFGQAFYGCLNYDVTATDGATARTEKVVSISQANVDCTALTTWNLTNFPKATAINSVFNRCKNLVPVPVLTLGSATGLGTFLMVGCEKQITPPLWDVKNCTTFTSILSDNLLITSFPNYDFSNGTGFLNAIRNCPALNGYDPPFTLNLRKMTNGTQFLQSSRISTTAWSNLLIDLAANNPNNNVLFHGGSSLRNAAGDVARTALQARGWTISDGGLAP